MKTNHLLLPALSVLQTTANLKAFQDVVAPAVAPIQDTSSHTQEGMCLTIPAGVMCIV